MKNLSDEQLISCYAQGKNEAFDELLNRYKFSLFNYIFSIIQNREMAEDVFQDTFTKVIITIKSNKYEESGHFASYLFRIAHNKIISIYRQEQSVIQINEADVDYDLFSNKEICDSFEEFIPSSEEAMCLSQVHSDIRKMIKYLPEEQREIIIMRFYKDMSFKDIAESLDISINTALGRMRYAVINMRKLAEKHHISLAV